MDWGEHDFISGHTYEMRCELCGKVVGAKRSGLERCVCDGLRTFSCQVCGFRMMTGGKSILDMIVEKRSN